MRNLGECMSMRGGYWSITFDAGVPSLSLDLLRSYSSSGIGFRLVYYR
jgi:hypothetical protein